MVRAVVASALFVGACMFSGGVAAQHVRPEVAVLESPVMIDRLRAAHALGVTGARGGVVPLARCLARDPEAEVRAACAAALGQIGDPSVEGPLRRAVERDADASVRSAASSALGRIGDRRHPPRSIDPGIVIPPPAGRW